MEQRLPAAGAAAAVSGPEPRHGLAPRSLHARPRGDRQAPGRTPAGSPARGPRGPARPGRPSLGKGQSLVRARRGQGYPAAPAAAGARPGPALPLSPRFRGGGFDRAPRAARTAANPARPGAPRFASPRLQGVSGSARQQSRSRPGRPGRAEERGGADSAPPLRCPWAWPLRMRRSQAALRPRRAGQSLWGRGECPGQAAPLRASGTARSRADSAPQRAGTSSWGGVASQKPPSHRDPVRWAQFSDSGQRNWLRSFTASLLLGCAFSTAHSRIYFSVSYLNNKTKRATFPFHSGNCQQCPLRMPVTTVRSSYRVKPGYKHIHRHTAVAKSLLKGDINNSKIETIKMKGRCLPSFEEAGQRNAISCPRG